MNNLRVEINGQPVGFSAATVNFSIEQLAHTFDLTMPYSAITNPLPVEAFLGRTKIFSGQIDGTSINTSADKSEMRVFGRSMSANLIDSRIKMDAVYNQDFDQLLKSVVTDFGLSVKNNFTGEMPEIFEFMINGESPVNSLATIAKQQNLTIIEDVGTLIIERPGELSMKNIRLEEGLNVKDLSIERNWSAQFYHYEVQGAWDGAEAIVTYAPANTCRKKVIIADKLQSEESCRLRAEFERDLAIAKGLIVRGTVPGLHQELTGKTINKNIEFKSKLLTETLLVKSISLTANASQEETRFELFRPFKEEFVDEY